MCPLMYLIWTSSHEYGGECMTRKFNKNHFIALVCFSLFIGAVIVQEMNVFGDLDSVDVVVAKHQLDKDTLIEEEDLVIKSVPREMYHENMIKKKEEIVGNRTIQTLDTSSFISPKYLYNGQLLPTDAHDIFPIPNKWLLELQGTLRRYDEVNIKAVHNKNVAQNKQAIDGEEDLLSEDELREQVDQNNANNEENVNEGKYIFTKVPVAYVKNTQNGEVTGANFTDDRLNGTSAPAEIELSLTPDQFDKLSQLNQAGYEFILSR